MVGNRFCSKICLGVHILGIQILCNRLYNGDMADVVCLASAFYDYCARRAVQRGLSQSSRVKSDPNKQKSIVERTQIFMRNPHELVNFQHLSTGGRW